MNRINLIIILTIVIVIIAFLLGFSVANSKSDINQNINNINIGTNTKDKTKVDINTANKEELMSINGIGDKKAELIIINRPYKNIWELSKINGISEEFMTKISGEVCVSAES